MKWIVVIIAALALGACAGEVDRNRSYEQEASVGEGARQVGLPAITNWQEMRMMKDLFELRDKAVVTYAYLQAYDGSLRCYGEGIGFALPYGTQFSNPENVTTGKPQAEPNGLFIPDAADATWYMMKDPSDGKLKAVQTEPNMIVSQFKLPCKPLDQ